MPRVTQDAYLAIRAFNIDIARVADSISSTSLGANIGKMRMQFWRDAVDKSYAQEPPKEPVAILLTQALNQLRDRGQKLPLKAWFHKVIQAREQYLNNPPYPSLSALESYSESTYSTLLYLTLAFLPMNSVTCDHIASHIGKAAGISTVLRGLPLLAFPPPPKHHSNTAGLGGVTGTQRQGTVLLPLEVMAEAGVKEEDVLRKGGDAPGLKDAVFKVATLANDHLITARTMLMNVRRGEDIGHPYEHEGEEGHGPETRKNASALAQDVDRAFGVFLPAVATQLWLDRLEKCDFNVFDPSLRRSNWKLPLKAYLADRRKRF